MSVEQERRCEVQEEETFANASTIAACPMYEGNSGLSVALRSLLTLIHSLSHDCNGVVVRSATDG